MNDERARTYVLRLLTLKPRSRKELFDKLKSKDYQENVINNVLDELEESGLINDRKFCFSWLRNRLEIRPAGKRLLKRELLEKGINKDLVDESIEEVFSKESPNGDLKEGDIEEDMAYNLANKRWKQYSKLDKIIGMRRLYSFLVRRGFGFGISERITKRIANDN